ncbi:MAG TPA: sterol desaturase family protein [Candidatus Limnocylindrales bacterium]|nr:sterol desaturase family protein [Candidatus Limnocylindrales bacterium]
MIAIELLGASAATLALTDRSLMASSLRAVAWVGFCAVTAELVGYLLHRLLHSERIRWLSRSHMEHHLEHYGPLRPMRPSGKYIDATTGRWSIGNVGLEWIAPSGIALGSFLAAFAALRLPWGYRISFVVITLAWSSFMFSYLHDRMHILGFWMEKNRWLKRWFTGARRLHDIHHLSLNGHGRMDRNFGIGFYFFDRLFGTFRGRQECFNRAGLEAAQHRYHSTAALKVELSPRRNSSSTAASAPRGVK